MSLPKNHEIRVTRPLTEDIDRNRIYEIRGGRKSLRQVPNITLDYEIPPDGNLAKRDRAVRRAIKFGCLVFQKGLAPVERYIVIKPEKKRQKERSEGRTGDVTH